MFDSRSKGLRVVKAEELITVKEAAGMVGIDPRTFLDLIHNGVIGALNVSTGTVKARWLIHPEAVRAFLAARTKPGSFDGGDGGDGAERVLSGRVPATVNRS